MFESDADRLATIQAVGGEEFGTGRPTRLWAIFDETYLSSELNRFAVANGEPVLICRTSDVAVHELVKQSKVTRVSDGSEYLVKDFEPDGTGMTVLRLVAS